MVVISAVQMNIKAYCAFHDISEILVDRTVLMVFLCSITNLTWTSLELNSGVRQKPANDHLNSFDTRLPQHLQDKKKTPYNFYLVIEVPDHVYVFYVYRLYFADKDISVSAILLARNVITLYCINTRTLYHGPSTTNVRTDTRSEHY